MPPTEPDHVPASPQRWAMDRAAQLVAGTSPHPNPRVGAVVVAADGTFLAEHAHQGPGLPHAEAAAIVAAGGAARGATVYVTLEPCSHHGKTPPCVDRLIAAEVAAVIVGATDPDPRVNGGGIAALRNAGIAVTLVEAGAMEQVDPGYFHHRRTGRPRVTLKVAATIDGQVAAVDGTSQWITSREARTDGHRLRGAADAVLVGAGTLRADDPQLTVRHPILTDRQPRPVVVAGMAPLPTERLLYGRDPIIYAPGGQTKPPDGAVVVAGEDPARVDLVEMLQDLGSRGIVDLLVEGGPTVAASLLKEGLADQLVVYLGAKLAGGTGMAMFSGVFATLSSATEVSVQAVSNVGPDLRLDIEVAPQRGAP